MDLSQVRIKEHFGLITNDTNTSRFSFHVSPPKNRVSVSKEDYVLVDHPTIGDKCQVLAQITEITSYQEVTGSTIGDRMGKMLAATEIIGYVDLEKSNRPFLKLLVPLNPGSRVHVPTVSFLEDVFNRNLKGENFAQPLSFGKVASETLEEENQISCFIDAQDLQTKHTLIAAMTGIGKTVVAKTLIQELAKKAHVPIVIVDHAGEYSNLNTDAQVVVLAARPDKVTRRLENTQIRTAALNDKSEKETLTREVKPGQITILNGRGLTVEERRIFYESCLKRLWKNRTDEIIEPFFLLVEEAENLKGETLDQIVTEGRKNGIAICLISIHPVELGGRVLSQIANQIVGKTTSKEDAQTLASMASVDSSLLAQLAVGEWVINGVNRARPMRVRVKE